MTQKSHRGMRMIPVLDIRNGLVVHAIAGDRSHYRPLQSRLVSGSDPQTVLTAIRRQLSCHDCYVADLDGIQNHRPDWQTLTALASSAGQLIVDPGVRTAADVHTLQNALPCRPVIASESFLEWNLLSNDDLKSSIVSIDLMHGHLLFPEAAKKPASLVEFVDMLTQRGAASFIILDLHAVGTGLGIPTLPLCVELRQRFPNVELISGGGVRSPDCLRDAAAAGLDGLLIASALHDGRITRSDFEPYRT